jgi:hypothetical protein
VPAEVVPTPFYRRPRPAAALAPAADEPPEAAAAAAIPHDVITPEAIAPAESPADHDEAALAPEEGES